jgi:KaiC/GvpD/RAD55 family RecA-like ATPase
VTGDRFRSRRTETDTYDLGDAVPIDGFETVPAGTNVLVTGPPMVGKQDVVLELLSAGRRAEHAIAVTPDTDGDRLRRRFGDVTGSDPDRLRVVDCTGATGKGSMDDTETVKYVGSPGDLTGIAMGIVKCTRDLGQAVDDGLRLSVLSLSTLLRYSNADRMFNFMHTVTGRVSAADYLGVGSFDPSMHSGEAANTLTSLFDVVVEIREADDGSREIRVVGHAGSSRTWQQF